MIEVVGDKSNNGSVIELFMDEVVGDNSNNGENKPQTINLKQ